MLKLFEVAKERDDKTKAVIAKALPAMDQASPAGRQGIKKFIQGHYKGLEQEKFNEADLKVRQRSTTY